MMNKIIGKLLLTLNTECYPSSKITHMGTNQVGFSFTYYESQSNPNNYEIT